MAEQASYRWHLVVVSFTGLQLDSAVVRSRFGPAKRCGKEAHLVSERFNLPTVTRQISVLVLNDVISFRRVWSRPQGALDMINPAVIP